MRVFVAISLVVFSAIPLRADPHWRSCRDHLLNGHFTSGVFSFHLRGRVFNARCEFPGGASKYSQHALLTSVVHSGLEKWLTLTGGSSHTVQFQINDWHFLKSLVTQSHECSQELLIQWPVPNGDGEGRDGYASMKKFKIAMLNAASFRPELRIESLSGMERRFTPNYTTGGYTESVLLNNGYAGVLHVHYGGEGITHLKTMPLHCQQSVVSKPNCLFTLSSVSDFLRLRVAEWMSGKGGSGKGPAIMEFAFRTDQPNGNFLSLRTIRDNAIEVVLPNPHPVSIDQGYLIQVNLLPPHPVKLLADGNWHTAYLDLRSLTLRFDSLGNTAISLISPASRQGGGDQSSYYGDWKIVEANVLLPSEITAIKVAGVGNEEQWLCGQSNFLQLHQWELPSRSICDGAGAKSYCNCKGPHSALQVGHHSALCSSAPKPSEAYRLARLYDKLSFFFIPNYTPISSLSISFKSDASTGLIAFASWSAPSAGRKHLRDADSGEEEAVLAVRTQIHFVGAVMYVARCSQLASGEERCRSCFIHRPKGFATSEWIRVSLFHFQNYQFMSVDEEVCQLSPNGPLTDGSELYKLSINPVQLPQGGGGFESPRGALLVGGTYYKKHSGLNSQLVDWFKRENTREKPPSLQGCIGEIYLRGKLVDLDRVLANQVELLTQKNDSSVFSIAKDCPECSPLCYSAPCLVSSTLRPEKDSGVCDCSAAYSKSLATGVGCSSGDEAVVENIFPHIPRAHPISLSLSTNETVALSVSDRDRDAIRSRMRASSRVMRAWLLLRFPRPSKEPKLFLKLGRIAGEAEEAAKLIMEDNYNQGFRQEFTLEAAGSDERLHLIAIEQTPSVGTSPDGKSISLRINNESRTLHGWEAVPVGIGDDFKIFPMGDGGVESGGTSGGCIAEFVVNYGEQEGDEREYDRDGQKTQDGQVDLLSLISENLLDAEPKSAQRLVVSDRSCGRRDSTLWSSPPSSPYGSVGTHDPEGVIGQWQQGSSGGWASILLCAFFILLLLIILCCYCTARLKRRRTESSFFRRQGRDGKLLKNSMANANEKEPLRVEAVISRTTTSSTTSGRTPSSIAAASASPLIRSPTPIIRTPIRPPSSPSSYVLSSRAPSTARENGHVHPNQFDRGSPLDSSTPVYRAEYVLVRDDRKHEEPPELVIEEFNTSPKYWRGHKPNRAVPPPEDEKDAPTEMRRSRVSVAAMPPTVPSPQQQAPIALQEE